MDYAIEMNDGIHDKRYGVVHRKGCAHLIDGLPPGDRLASRSRRPGNRLGDGPGGRAAATSGPMCGTHRRLRR